MDNEREGDEHAFPIDGDSALIIYCATCLTVIADFDKLTTETRFQGDMIADNHWHSFTKDHCVVVWDIKGGKGEYLFDTPEFQVIEGDDD